MKKLLSLLLLVSASAVAQVTNVAIINPDTLAVRQVIIGYDLSIPHAPGEVFPLIDDPKPTPATNEVVIHAGFVVEVPQGRVRRTWTVRLKSTEELDEDQRKIDLQQVKNVLDALNNGTGNITNRVTRCERVLVYIIKHLLKE